MKKTFFLLITAMLFGVAMPMMAQNSVQMTNETTFITAKAKGSLNIRKSPNAKAPKVGSLTVDQTLPVISEQNGWYQVLLSDGKKGWISKTVCGIMNTPLDASKVCDHVYGVSETYEDYVQWSVARLEGTDMYVAITCASNMDTPVSCPWLDCLWIGRQINNVLVFDQFVYLSPQYSPDNANLFNLTTSDYITDEISYTLYFGDKFSMPDNQGDKRFRPSVLTQKTIKQLFNGKQKKGRYLFLGPALFGKKYANVVFG